MEQASYFFIFIFLITGCSNTSQPPIQLQDFTNDISVKKLGERLIDLPYGLNAMEPSHEEAQEIFIAVHGGSSQGYEWIYPLKTIDTKQKDMYFYRWPDNGCFQGSAESLVDEIKNILSLNTALKKVSLIGHSYGGVLATYVLKNWNHAIPIEVHVVASPLLGTPMLKNVCGYEPIEKIPNNSELYEWRTLHHLDNAYKDLSEDPQEINIKGSMVTTLPETYRDNRLGHNWSISWVADQAF